MDNFRNINVQLIDRPNPPVRLNFNEEEITALTESIRERGILVPLLVREVGERFEVIDGDCRLEACARLRLREAPCVVRNSDDSETHVLRLLANLDRSNPDVVSEAVYIARAIHSGSITFSELAQKLKRSEQWLKDRLQIAEMPDYMQAALHTQALPLGVCLKLYEIENEQARKRWFDAAMQGPYTIAQAIEAVRIYTETKLVWEERPAEEAAATIPDEPPVSMRQCAKCGTESAGSGMRLVSIHRGTCPTQ